MTTETTKVCCPCGAKWSCKNGLTSEFLDRQGWEKIGKQWYCDDCAPYKKKSSLRGSVGGKRSSVVSAQFQANLTEEM